MRLADIDPLARQAVVVQQPSITGLEFTFGGQVVDRRAQTVAPMPPRHSPQFPQCVLQTVGQCLERLRCADGHRFPVGVREHEVIRQMLEAFAENGDAKGIHAGEIRGGQITGAMHLAEHHRACLTGRGAPLLDAPLERAALGLGKLAWMLALKPVKQCLGSEARLCFQPGLGLLPQILQRVLPRSVGAWPLLGAGQCTQRAILACRLFVHSSPPGCDRQLRRL